MSVVSAQGTRGVRRTTVRSALRAAVLDGYRHSWRLVLLNCAVGGALAAAAVGSVFALPLAAIALAAGPLLAVLAHCVVVVVRSGDLDWSDAAEGLRGHWRHGLSWGALAGSGTALGILAIHFYAGRGMWTFLALAGYLLAAFWFWLVTALLFAVADPAAPLRAAFAASGRELLRRPGAALLLGIVLLAVNLVGAVAVMPLLTITLAYTFLAVAHLVLPPDPVEEA